MPLLNNIFNRFVALDVFEVLDGFRRFIRCHASTSEKISNMMINATFVRSMLEAAATQRLLKATTH